MRDLSLPLDDLAEILMLPQARSAGLLLQGVALGTSMAPLIRAGDRLSFRARTASEIRVGDVVLFRRVTGDFVAHRVRERIVAADGIRFITGGDADPVPDPGMVSESAVLGILVSIERPSWVRRILGRCRRGLARLSPSPSPLLPGRRRRAVAPAVIVERQKRRAVMTRSPL